MFFGKLVQGPPDSRRDPEVQRGFSLTLKR